MTGNLACPEAPHNFRESNAGIYLDQSRLEQEQRKGYWPGHVLTDYFETSLAERPDDLCLLTYRTDIDAETSFTYASLNDRVSRIAAGFSQLGVNKGDVVSFQLPNWWEFIAVHLACIRSGVVSNPLMPIFRERELEFMVGRAKSRLLITPGMFRKFDHEAMAKSLLHKLPLLKHTLIVGGSGDDAFERLFEKQDLEMTTVETRLQPDDIMQIMFTSGTTGKPKGVLHTSNTLLSSISEVQKRLQLTSDDVLFMPSPFAHSIGFHYGIMLSIYLGAPLVTMDVWDPEKAVDLIERHGITYMFASTPFLSDLVNVTDLKRHNIDSLRIFMTAGAPVPPTLVEEAGKVLNADIITGWGMTEIGLVTSTLPSMQQAGIGTDGLAMPCSEVRVIDDNGKELPRGDAGNLQCRGSTTFVGYYRRPDLYKIDEHGWFDTGDLATMNGDGYISIVGRSKDIIIRGGENIPVVEVEKLIFEIPQVKEVALLGIPDPRLGEKSCAFVSLYPGNVLTLADITSFLHARNLAKQYMPERLEIIDKMPKTPSGKIQKFVLRDHANSLSI